MVFKLLNTVTDTVTSMKSTLVVMLMNPIIR